MKKKIFLLVVCAVLLLIFTSIGFGKGNGKYQLLARPDQELMLSAFNGDQFDDILILVILNCNGLFQLVCVEREPGRGIATLQNLNKQRVESKTNSTIKRSR